MTSRTNRFSWSTGAAASLMWMMTLAGPATAQTHTTQKAVEVFDLTIPSCSGEPVHIFGTIDVDVQTTVNKNGSTISAHFTPHLTAIGLVSGLSYIAVGPASEVAHTGAAGGTAT